MASLRPRSSIFVAVSLFGCQRLEITDETGDNSLTFADTGSSSGGDEATVETGSGGADTGDTSMPEFDCEPVLQTGCAANEKCTAIVSGGSVTYTCVADPGGLDAYEGCEAAIGSGIDGCNAGLVCIADDLDAGVCEPLCVATSDCTDAICIDEPLHHVPYCANECSPFDGGCAPPTQCRRGEDRFACMFASSDDAGAAGEPCITKGDAGCAEGYVCVAGALVPNCADDNCCASVCDVVENACDLPSTCTPIFASPAPGSENIGACLVPS